VASKKTSFKPTLKRPPVTGRPWYTFLLLINEISHDVLYSKGKKATALLDLRMAKDTFLEIMKEESTAANRRAGQKILKSLEKKYSVRQ
jgi:hypothetical protein